MKTIIKFLVSGLLILGNHSCVKDKSTTAPIVKTTAVTEISYTTATSGGETVSDGGETILSRGICWNTSAKPTIANNFTSDSNGLGSFTSHLTLLNANTLYYVRAYATNKAGTGYGDQLSFTTSQIGMAELTTSEVSSVKQMSATSGGNVTAENGGSITSRGVCWSTNENPTTSDSKTTDGTGTGSFISSMSNLLGNTKYYVRSYAINSAGTQYGNQVSFTTRPMGWIKVTNIPVSPRFNPRSFIIGDSIYIGLGRSFPDITYSDWWRYSINENSWKKLDDFPGGKIGDGLSISMKGMGYIFSSRTELFAYIKELWKFNPVNRSWTRLADFPGPPRDEAASFVVDDKLFIGTGIRNGYISMTDFYNYNQTTNVWSRINDYPGDSIYGAGAFTIGTEVHFVTGVVNNDERTKIHYLYNSVSDTWSEQSAFPGRERIEGCGYSLLGMGYFGLGSITNNSPARDLWKYDPVSKNWTPAEDFIGNPRFTPAYGSNGIVAYYGFGYYGSNAFSDLYLYYPVIE